MQRRTINTIKKWAPIPIVVMVYILIVGLMASEVYGADDEGMTVKECEFVSYHMASIQKMRQDGNDFLDVINEYPLPDTLATEEGAQYFARLVRIVFNDIDANTDAGMLYLSLSSECDNL